MTAGSSQLPRLGEAEWLKSPRTQAGFQAIEAGGYPARAVGGVVRNALLGEPVGDVDIATPAPPEEVMRLATAAGLKAVATGLQHGSVTIVSAHTPYEVPTLREDVETFGRHARVAFTDDWAADARRRDFTINALYCDARGAIHDPLGGFPDLLARRVRFIGDPAERIREDYLRILRFFRLTAVYAVGPPDSQGLAAAVRERNGLTRLSGERIRQELVRLLAARRAAELIEVMRDFGLLTMVLPVAPRSGIMRRLIGIEQALGLDPNATLRMAALGVEVFEDAVRLRDRLRLSNVEFETLARAADAARKGLHPDGDEDQAKVCLYRFGATATREQLLLNWARSTSPPDDPRARGLYALTESWQPPTFPLSGADVLAAGIPPGPRVGEVLGHLEKLWLDSDFTLSREQLRAELMRLISSTN